LTRIWGTSIPASEWLFYVDGEVTPRIRRSKAEIFGGALPFLPPLSDIVSGGRYSYVPIPFADSLRIAVAVPPHNPSMRPYYHVNYASYPPGTHVESLPVDMSTEEVMLIEDVNAVWERKDGALSAAAATCGELSMVSLAAGEVHEWFDLEGPGLLSAIVVKIAPSVDVSVTARARLLRELVLRIYWDDSPRPSVDVPLGDFFCNGLFWRAFSALPLGNIDGRFISRFPMPFASRARAELRNDGRTPVTVGTAYAAGPLPDGLDRRFHACWTSSVSRGVPHSVLGTRGEGHFVGCYLTAIGMDGTWTILEGDESIRVDGELVPSWHGTGLEDYFNGAWYYTGLFDLPLHGLVEKAPIRTDQFRFHLLDSIPFDKRIDIRFEFGDRNRARGYMSSTAYWYQRGISQDVRTLPDVAYRFPPPDPLAPRSIMGCLFELERIGHLTEARDRCLIFGETHGSSSDSAVIRLRAAAYREATDGIEAVREQYVAFAQKTDAHAAAREARDLLWFHEDSAHALLGVHSNGKYSLYLDGKAVASGDAPKELAISRQVLSSGDHEFSVEFKPTRPDSWFSLHLRTHVTNVVSDSSWVWGTEEPKEWPGFPGLVPASWDTVGLLTGADMLPRMGYWQFSPNAFVGMQSAKQLIRPWKRGGVRPGASIFLRRRFKVPSSQENLSSEPQSMTRGDAGTRCRDLRGGAI